MKTLREARAKVALVVTSGTTSPSAICSALERTPSKSVVKGTPTGSAQPAAHPFNIVVIASQLENSTDVLEHLEDVLCLVESKKLQLKRLARKCVAEIHINYATSSEGGWTFEPKLLRRMANLGLKVVVSVNQAQRPVSRQKV